MSETQQNLKVRERFVRQRMREVHRIFADTGMTVLLVSNAIMFVMDVVVAQPQNRIFLHFARLATMLGCLEYFHLSRLYGHRARYFAQLVYFGAAAVAALMAHRMVAAGDLATAAVPFSYFLATSFFYVLGTPFRLRGVIVASTVYAAMSIAASWPELEFFAKYSFVQVATLLFATFLHAALDRVTASGARSEIETRLKIAPIDLVRRSHGHAPEAAGFELKREQHRCICLASDWRGYQALSRAVTPEVLQTTLGAYYDMCRTLLAELFPDGDYFCDWIADELLIFFVIEDEARSAQKAQAAVAYARLLIERKAAFSRRHGIPHGIDIGLAVGRASVGLYGPVTNRKVMAIGRVAVDARKLQTLGKQLRISRGDQDRIIYDGDVYELGGKSALVHEMSVGMQVHVAATPVRVLYEEPMAVSGTIVVQKAG